MPQEVAISARNHRTGITQQCHNRVPRGRCLPFVPAYRANAEQSSSDLLLGGATACPVESLQHSARSHPLLSGQPGIRRNGPPVKRRQEAMGGLQPTKSVDIQWNQGHRLAGPGGQKLNLDMLAVG